MIALSLALAGCSAGPRKPTGDPWMSYREALRRAETIDSPAPGSQEESAALERFKGLLSDFKAADFADRIRDVYAEEVWFNDTLKTIEGIDALEEYLLESAAAVESTTVEFEDLVASEGNYYLRWSMQIRFKKLKRGETTSSIGMTHLRFNRQGKVILHQDFWDSAAGLFEHVPAVGWMIRRIKGRL